MKIVYDKISDRAHLKGAEKRAAEIEEVFGAEELAEVSWVLRTKIDYRNWAAHGWHTTGVPAPSNITAEDAYQRLTDFLIAAGIVT